MLLFRGVVERRSEGCVIELCEVMTRCIPALVTSSRLALEIDVSEVAIRYNIIQYNTNEY